MTEIERLNPNIRDLIAQSRRPINKGAGKWLNELPILTLLHLSDPHRAVEELKRLVAFAEDMGGLLDDVVCSGDMFRKNYLTGYEFWAECGCDNILTCIGNHDALNNNEYNWADVVPQAELYATVFAPFIEKWGVEYTPGTTYYCKRYPDHKIDLIVLNTMLPMDEDAAQTAFLQQKLDRALAEEISVLIMLHDTSDREQTVIPCRFSRLDHGPTGPCSEGLRRRRQELEHGFTEAGGDFICYLAGHCHEDFICCDPDFPRQILFLAPTASREKGIRQSDCDRVEGEKSQDAFNIMSFDRTTKLIKLIRVGADRDRYLRHRGVLCFDYANGKIVYED